MLLKKFKSNHTFNFILFPLLGVLFWLRDFLYPHAYPFYPEEAGNLLYAPIHNILQHSLLLQNLVALVLFILLAFIVLQINNRYNFIRVRTMIPATLFVIMAGGFTEIHALHPIWFGAVFFLIAVYRLLGVFDHPQPFSPVFDSGFFLGISSLFYFNLSALFPVFLIGTGILSKESKWREFAILIIGFLLPFLFGASYAWFNDSLHKYLVIIESNVITYNDHFLSNTALQIYSGVLLFITLLGSFKLLKDYDTKKVSTRKFSIIFFLIFLNSIAGIVFIPAVSQEMLIITIVPVTFLISNYFVFQKSRYWGEFIFLLLIFVVIIMQFIS